ncbi:MAG: hypothetical protein AAF617_14005 [Bacteroidota bacterium]
MTYQIPVLSLQKLYMCVLLSVGMSLVLMLIITFNLSYVFPVKSEEIIFVFTMICIVLPAFIVMNRIEEKITKHIEIQLHTDAILIEDQPKILTENIKNYKIERLAKNYPALIIYDEDDTKYVIRCAEKYNGNFEKLTNHLQKLLNTEAQQIADN